jgi:capsular exopolysaccharide synthesis family protein
MEAQQQRAELDLLGYLRVLRRRWWIALLVPLLGGGAAYVQARSQSPVYRSQTNLLVERTTAEELFALQGNGTDPTRALANQIRIIQSQDVHRRATQQLGFEAKVTASAAKDEDVITITGKATEKKRAADVANAYAAAYIANRVESARSENQVAQAEIQRQIDDVQSQVRRIDAGNPKTIDQTTRSGLVDTVTNLQAQLSRLKASSEVTTGGVQILQKAPTPAVAFEPRPARSLALGLGIGLLLGLSFAFLIDYLDDTVKDKEDLARVTPDLPVLALIPRVQGWRNRRETMLISLERPNDPVAEAYRTLRTSIQFLGLDRSIKTIQVTSAVAGEGKTTTLANLAITLSRAGRRVVVVCCDLRHPRVHEFFGVSNGIGFTSVLLGDVPLAEALQKAGDSQIRLLASGPPPPNPSELLGSARTADVLDALKSQSDIVLLDCPPLLPVTDAAVLSHKVDATLLVVTAGSTTRGEYARSIETLKQVDAPLIGCVLNGVSGSEQYGYRYGYYYRPEPEPRGGRARAAAGR